jgi:hypothetical protein
MPRTGGDLFRSSQDREIVSTPARPVKPPGEECASDRLADHPRDDRYDEANSPEPEQVADERPSACGEERVDASVHVRPLVNEGHHKQWRAD